MTVLGSFPTSSDAGHALVVDLCQGNVVVQDCVLRGGGDAAGTLKKDGGAGAYVVNSQEVAFVRTQLTGGNGPVPYWVDCFWQESEGMDGGPGLFAAAAVIYAFDGSFAGGTGQTDTNHGGAGGHGADSDTMLLASRCVFQGGNGGDATEPSCDWDAGEGGDGLSAFGTTKVLECTMGGGTGGMGAGAGNPGQPFHGPVDTLEGTGRSLYAPSLVQGPAPLTVDLAGVQGELVYLLVSAEFDPGVTGSGVLFASSFTLLPLGPIPPGSALSLTLPLPALPQGIEHLVLLAQGLFVDPSGATWPRLSGFSTLVWL
jgi:hypothetical protein